MACWQNKSAKRGSSRSDGRCPRGSPLCSISHRCIWHGEGLGSVELAAQFARELAGAALRFAQRCAELMPGPAVVVPGAPGESGASNGA